MSDQPLARHPLTHLRRQRGWSLTDLAQVVQRRAGVNMAANRQKIWRWEHGLAVPDLPAQLAIATEVGIDPNTVAALPWPTWLLTVDGMERIDQGWTTGTAKDTLTLVGCMTDISDDDRRAYLLLTGQQAADLATAWAAVPAVPTIPTSKLRHATGHGIVDAELAGWVEGRVHQLWHLDDLIGGDYCLTLAQADLQLIRRLLEQARFGGLIEQRLLTAAGELLRLTGWCAFDADRHAAAERYWHAGLRTSAAGGDTLTGAYILSLMAMQHSYAGDGRTAINLLQTARERIGPGSSRTVHAMLDAWQVRAHAAAGEAAQALKALARADAHWERRDPDEDPAWAYWMRRPSHTIEVGLGFVGLGRTDTAVRLLEEGQAGRSLDYTRDTALGLTAIASAQAEQGDLNGALENAGRAADLMATVDSSRVTDLLQSFSRRLPHGPVQTAFQARLETLAQAPDQSVE
ncbi:hypothetical protein SAMN05421505_1605 [Sinosporangium album]|uniref:HTH cro/C1-type domain-containing protein n=1 Tax=Sinosporangium album TaxID=504805 RepID=A0A1G8L2A4_9ACTN|nr:helix-turn-helix transcriptional regulator [Sinosporangium album]SDI49795.1 hypothetical protein SAMN05421505_1605 [Sinosporangium album]